MGTGAPGRSNGGDGLGLADCGGLGSTPTTTRPSVWPASARRGQKRELVEGADNLLVYGDDALNDTRCAMCGSLLLSVVRDGEYVHVALGSLVDAPSIRPTEHIFVGSKAPWFEITDDLPQAQEYD